MTRIINTFAKIPADARSKAMYRRMIACWAVDMLSSRMPVTWLDHHASDSELSDDQDWHRLYGGSVLDD